MANSLQKRIFVSVRQRPANLAVATKPDLFVRKQRENQLALTGVHVLALFKLPAIHHDPFDRMLVCQAVAEGLTILTPDEAISQYPVRTAW